MGQKEKNHYSPIVANKAWCDETNHFLAYERNIHAGRVSSLRKGKAQWGRVKNLYPRLVEEALDRELETKIGEIFGHLQTLESLDPGQRKLWAQFLRSQFVRTPSFIRYEELARAALSISERPACDRVGCEHCLDLHMVTGRDWMLLVAHEDDYFVRTDNPVYTTGFLEDPDSVLYYPLGPKICFVACSMPQDWEPLSGSTVEGAVPAYALDKGGALMLNFHFCRSADRTLIIHPAHQGWVSEAMFTEILGLYPQPPFDLHHLGMGEKESLLESLRRLMCAADDRDYSSFNSAEMGPRYFPHGNDRQSSLK